MGCMENTSEKIGQRYKSKTGETVRTPQKFNDNKRMVYCLVEAKSKTFYKWYYNSINIRQFEIKL